MQRNCLYCYKALGETEPDFHAACGKKFFGEHSITEFSLSQIDIQDAALVFISRHAGLTGVQPKLSLDLVKNEVTGLKRLTVVGLWGNYILKPPASQYPLLPEIEDLSMHLAEMAGIKTVPHSLIRMADGSLAFITKRIDRSRKGRLHMEDLCQLTDHLTEHKYRGSYEQAGKAINKYSIDKGLDMVKYAEILLFSFIIGNADMHLKNFSIIHKDKPGPVLSPAYDLLSTALVTPDDNEEMALTLNGKKNKLTRKDFIALFNNLGLQARQQDNIFERLFRSESKWLAFIDQSFLPPSLQSQFKELIRSRIIRLS